MHGRWPSSPLRVQETLGAHLRVQETPRARASAPMPRLCYLEDISAGCDSWNPGQWVEEECSCGTPQGSMARPSNEKGVMSNVIFSSGLEALLQEHERQLQGLLEEWMVRLRAAQAQSLVPAVSPSGFFSNAV